MPKGSFEYKDFLKLRQNMLEAEKQIDPWLEDFFIEQGVKALNLAKPRTPVDTGLLQKSWQLSSVTRKGNTLMLDLFNEVEYASYMEHGFTCRGKTLRADSTHNTETSCNGRAHHHFPHTRHGEAAP